MQEMPEMVVSIPANVENVQLPNPELLTYYRNLQNRVLWLDSDCDESWLEFIRNILAWNAEDKGVPEDQRRPIKLMLFSYGGEFDIYNALVDIIANSKTPIWAVNIGQACSAACFISIACHKRFALPNATYLIHQGAGSGFSGTYEQVVAAVYEYQRKMDDLYEYLKAKTNIPDETLEKRISTEWFLSAEEALKYGICDEIVTDLDAIL